MFCNGCGRGLQADDNFCTKCGVRVGGAEPHVAAAPVPPAYAGQSYRLERPRKGRWIAGVCAAVAVALEMDVTIVRVLWLALTILGAGFPGVIAYIIAWVVIPEQQYMLIPGYYAQPPVQG